MQHGSNNKSAQFTDVELMTAYLWGAQQGLLTRKSIYNFIRTYHLGEFQKLPSYQAFCRRLNRLAEAFAALAEVLFEQKACQQRADARVCAGFLPGHGVCRFPVKYCENGAKSLQFNEKSHEKPVVPRSQAARFCAAAAASASHPLHRTDQQSQSLRPVGCKADPIWTAHRSQTAGSMQIVPISTQNGDPICKPSGTSRSSRRESGKKVRCSCFRRCRIHPHQCPAAADRGLFQLAAGQNAHPVCFARPFLRRSALPHLLLPRFRRPPLAVQLLIRIPRGAVSEAD